MLEKVLCKRMMVMEKRRKHFIAALSNIIKRLSWQNNEFCVFENIRTSFCSTGVFPLTIKQYLMRIAFYTGCTEESLIFSLIYIDRLGASNSRYLVTSYNVHRLVLTSVLVAAKFYDDIHFKNSYYAMVGGISIKEINRLEVLFLHELKFDLRVGKKLYDWYRKCFDQAIFIDKSFKTRTHVEPAKVVIAVPMSCYKLVTESQSITEKQTQNPEYAKHIPSVRCYQPATRNDYFPNPPIPRDLKENYGNRSSQPSYIPTRCYGPEMCYWQGNFEPMVGSA